MIIERSFLDCMIDLLIFTLCMHVLLFLCLIDFIEQYGSLPPPPPASVLEDPLVTGTSRDPLLPLGVFLFELTLFFLFFKAASAF